MKKYAPYILILFVLVGLLSPVHVDASATNPTEPCAYASGQGNSGIITNAPCKDAQGVQQNSTISTTQGVAADASTTDTGAGIGNNLNSCRIIGVPHLNGCYEQIIYWIFYEVPSFLLGVIGNFFNVIVSLTLSSTLYGATFIGNAWTVVRDLSNIFFIIILLYVAIQTILGLGHEIKKVIVQVIIMALLINFSMFFSKVVIDTSNILALVFYNKINVGTAQNYVPVVSLKNSGVQDKDISGAMMSYFDPTKVLSKDFFDKFRQTTYTLSAKGLLASAGAGALIGSWVPIIGTGIGATIGTVGYFISSSSNDIPTGIIVGFILIAGFIICFAAYAFFIAGLSFLARMIELWILVIFSPFAFMSNTIPLLSGGGYIGWDAWIKRLLKLSFMAPVFMFFLYLIFTIIQSNIFASLIDRPYAQQGWMEAIILMVIPALVILILLHKTTKFAKEASGELGEMLIKGVEVAGGIAGGLALGGAAVAGKTLLGGGGGFLANKLAGQADKGMNSGNRFVRGLSRFGGEKLRDIGTAARKSSYDLREGAAGTVLAAAGSISGLNLGHSSKFFRNEGGWDAMKKEQIRKRQERAVELAERGTSPEKKAATDAEIKLREATLPVKLKLENADKLIDKLRKDMQDAAPSGKDAAAAALKTAKEAKEDIKVQNGLDLLEKNLHKAKHNLEKKSEKIKGEYAEKVASTKNKVWESFNNLGGYSWAGAEEASNRIRLGAQIEGSGSGKAAHSPTPAAPKPKPAAGGGPAPSGGSAHS